MSPASRPDPQVADVVAAVVARGDRSRWVPGLVEDCRAELQVAGVGLALADAGGLLGVAAATPGAGQAGEDLQFGLGEGPCRTATATGRLVHAVDLSTDDRWVLFGTEALALGIHSAFSAPLDVGAVRIGVLDLYRDVTGPLSPVALRGLQVYAAAATAVLLLLAHADAGVDRGEDAADLADIRPVVHQATGMVSIQLGVDLDVALLRLRGHALAAGASLPQVAADVVARRTTFTGGAAHAGPTHDGPPGDPPDGSDEPDRTGLEKRDDDEHS